MSSHDLPLILGHRGARHAVLENTLEAFELARQEGAAGSELDVQLSRDGVPYVVHDLDLARITGAALTSRVAELSSHELDAVRLPGDLRIPTLASVLDWARAHAMFLNIELKTAAARRDPVGRVVAELLERTPDTGAPLVVSSFHPLVLLEFHRVLPRVPTGFLLSEQRACLANPNLARRLGCTAIHPQATLLLRRPELMQRLSGLAVNTWTVNEPEQARRLASLGVNAIISDCPGKILQGLGKDP